MRYLPWVVAAGVGFLAVSAVGMAATESGAPKPVYMPSTNDLMQEVIQPRHQKLWLAGQSQNWALAEYERHNLAGAFKRFATAMPTQHGKPTDPLVMGFITPGLVDLETAIKAKNEAAFVQAYQALTTGCNGCHQATGQDLVKIVTPTGNPFPDQDFSASAH
ncbi:MAG TPA: hypothetical protein VFG12_04910 [Rhodopila sp.]|jgi:hypothetical protein|nr:hypothetical protein [Rhodopila sp.]